jgi:hypothetical protein
MTGSLLQLVAKGVDDLYIIGTPQITLFKTVYRRTINFSIFDEIISPRSSSNFSSSFTIPIERRADFLHRLKLLVDLPDIVLARKSPTFIYVNSILKSFGVNTWDYSPHNNLEIVNISDYNGHEDFLGIVSTINNLIILYINTYNLFVNAVIRSFDSTQIISFNAPELSRLVISNFGPLLPSDIVILQSALTYGRNVTMTFLFH